jgi:hypothetical protein
MRYYLAAAAALALQITTAHADTIVALTEDNWLATIDTDAGKVIDRTKIEGFGQIVGIDVRPSDGQLYALSSDGNVGIVDPRLGDVTPKSQLIITPPAGVKISVDFNPVADRMRIIGGDGTNLRANVDDGKVTEDKRLNYAANEPASGLDPMVIAGAYSNSVKGTKETTLYDIDGRLSNLVRQTPPNDGVLNVVGTLGVDSQTVGFDIVTDAPGVNRALLIAEGKLYSVDLGTANTTLVKSIAGLKTAVLDIAIMPNEVAQQADAGMMKMDAGRKMDGGDKQAVAAPVFGTQQNAYLPPKVKAMDDDIGMMEPAMKPKMQPKAQMKKKPATYRKQADYGQGYYVRKEHYAAPKLKRGKEQCNNDAEY